ncbi:CDP-alcohol phosphatidyltransferase family protein [Lysobacter sp. HDW10]|uniref:CDP-alcohol phosphatidyltransferase family protein n=1 Tax=Lysobacter sp. HDW10 TaxID=2714936 RepID=UPI001408EC52|nr:CDP-alcohol phosphatidyltransferase family protein [Lysobacter sp. HDW10]QIK81281.1 CDP-alcohol phosphatidyltransferase family protein [Lysobacter sp. HDW10]
MISIYAIKPAFQRLLSPLLSGLQAAGITPNQITCAALFISVVQGAALYLWPDARWVLALYAPVLLIRMALDALDGMLARRMRLESRLGALLNELGDVLADIALYLPFIWVAGIHPALALGVVLLALVAEFTGVLAQAITGTRAHQGPMGKSDRAFAYAVLALMCAAGVSPGLRNGLLAVIALLLVWTLFNRCRASLKHDAPQTP